MKGFVFLSKGEAEYRAKDREMNGVTTADMHTRTIEKSERLERAYKLKIKHSHLIIGALDILCLYIFQVRKRGVCIFKRNDCAGVCLDFS